MEYLSILSDAINVLFLGYIIYMLVTGGIVITIKED